VQGFAVVDWPTGIAGSETLRKLRDQSVTRKRRQSLGAQHRESLLATNFNFSKQTTGSGLFTALSVLFLETIFVPIG